MHIINIYQKGKLYIFLFRCVVVSLNSINLNMTGYSSLQNGGVNSNIAINDATKIETTKQSKQDSIEFSDSAKSYLSSMQYEKFMPTRSGFSSQNIAIGVSDPSAEPFSQKRNIIDVAQSARENLNQKYDSMKQSGTPFSFDSFEGKDWYSAFGDLDRRALFAIRSNIGGQFTKQEQDIAQSIMSTQEGLAMGLYSGPTSLAGDFSDKFAGNDVARFKAYENYLSRVSDDEKSSGEWILANDGAKRGYQSIVENEKYRREHSEEKGLTLLDIITQISKKISEDMENRKIEDLEEKPPLITES